MRRRTSKRADKLLSPSCKRNFPRPGILKLPCRLLGRVGGHRRLEPTDEELNQYLILLNRAVDSQMSQDGSSLNRMATHSWLVTVSVLQKLISFLGGPDNRKLSDHHGNEGQLSQQMCSLFLCHSKKG